MIDYSVGETSGETNRPPARSPGGVARLSDERCALLARSGQAAARDELVNRYAGRIYGLLARLLADREEAVDATQEVFLRLFAHLDQFDSNRRFRAWVFSIAWNHFRDRMRRRGRRGGRVTISFEGFRSSSAGERRDLEPVDPRASSPDERLQQREQAAWVRQGLDRLEPRQKALLVLREYEGLSYAEISDLLGLRVGSVKSRIHRARMTLKNELQRLRPDWVESRSDGRPRR